VSFDTGIADRLRAAGLRVIEMAGWQTYGSSSFSPGGSVNHHTAGPSSGSTPSLLTCQEGRPDLAGPLCNVYQSREPDEDIAYVIAAGRANHAGEGGWRGLSGNASVYGLEVEHTGTSSVPAARLEVAARIHAAMFEGDPSMVCQHSEWTSRKIDFATNITGDGFRDMVANAGKPAPAPIGDDDVSAAVEGSDGRVFATDGITKRHIETRQQLNELALIGAVRLNPDGREWQVSDETIDAIPEL
jgi:hypothetical protein